MENLHRTYYCALQCVAVCCSELQYVAVCCSMRQYIAACCRVLQSAAVCCRVLQCVAVYCSVLQCVAVCCSVLQRTRQHLHWRRAHMEDLRLASCSVTVEVDEDVNAIPIDRGANLHVRLQCIAVSYSVLQCVAVCCSVLQCVAVCSRWG